MDGKRIAALLVAADVLLVPLIRAVPAAAATAPGAPGADATWDESQVTGFADSLGASSKVWYTLGNGELENAFYPETDIPDTFGLQYIVTNGTSFASTETAGTSHSISLADPDALVWQQVNKATGGDFTISKTYIADPSRSVVLVQTTFDNLTSSPLQLYADYHPQLDNDGMGNSGGTDATSGDLVASNSSVSSALAASTGFSQTSTGYVGSSSDGETALTSSYTLGTTYSSVPSGGHIDQIGQIPLAASGSTTFTLALAFDSSQSAAISDASASLAAGFSSLETSFESGWDSWLGGLNSPPASVVGSAALTEQYDASLMEVKADEDKTYAGAFVAAPTVPWGTSVSADTGTGTSGAHGYHAVWTRDEYEMATALLAAGDSTDALAALNYIFGYEVESNGAVKQNTWLNGTAVFGSLQMDEVADPIILAYQLGATGSSDWAAVVTSCLQESTCPVSGSVKETVNVTVPVNTDASGDTVYLDGNLSALGLGQPDWAAAGIPMTRVSATQWTATIDAAANATLSYKYDLGGNRSNVEKDADCADIGNRSMTVNGGGTVNDTVANWGGPSACGDSGAVVNVTVPASTPSGDTVYLSGNYDVLGTGIPSSDDWAAADYPMTQTGPDTWSITITGVPVATFQYKFTLGSWRSVEETASCGAVANRDFGFDTAGATYPANDTVAAWAALDSC